MIENKIQRNNVTESLGSGKLRKITDYINK